MKKALKSVYKLRIDIEPFYGRRSAQILGDAAKNPAEIVMKEAGISDDLRATKHALADGHSWITGDLTGSSGPRVSDGDYILRSSQYHMPVMSSNA